MDAATRQRLAQNIRELMLQKGWSQSELARRAGVGNDNLSRYLQGKYVPSVKNLARIADALGVAPRDLYAKITHDENGEYAIELKTLPGDPSRAWIRLNQVLPTAVALQILGLANDTANRNTPPQSDGLHGQAAERVAEIRKRPSFPASVQDEDRSNKVADE